MKQPPARLLTSKANEGVIIVVENFNFDKPSTKGWMSIAKSFKVDEKKTFLAGTTSIRTCFSVRNVPERTSCSRLQTSTLTQFCNNDAIIMTEKQWS